MTRKVEVTETPLIKEIDEWTMMGTPDGWPGRVVISLEYPDANRIYWIHDNQKWWEIPLPVEASEVHTDVLIERARQDQEYGGPTTDDKHTPLEWCGLITQHTGRALWAWKEMIRASGSDEEIKIGAYRNARRHLVNAAALAIAAVESLDRKFGDSQEENSEE